VGCQPEEPVERSYNTACYREQGGDKWVCGDGGEFELQSGATLDIQSGVTTDFSSGIDLDGALLDLDTNGNTSIQADTDDQIDIEISGEDDFQFTANTFTILSGSSLVANGAIDANDNIDQDGSANEVQLSVTGYTTQTTDLVQFSGGLTDIGGGSYDTADGDDDLGVAGDLEVDGELELDGALDADSTANIAGAATLQSTLDVASTINYGSNDMYPLGYASASQEIVCGTTTITGTNQTVAVTGITTVTYGFAWLITDPGAGADDPWMVTTDAPTGSDGNIVVNVWEDNLDACSGPAVIGYCAIGDE